MIAIMQGRLLPPIGGQLQAFPEGLWEREFPLAREAGLDAIEWIYDSDDPTRNPLADERGLDAVASAAATSGVLVRSICADLFMAAPFVRASPAERRARVRSLSGLVARAAGIGVTRVVLPFVDASRIAAPRDADDALGAIEGALPAAEAAGVELHLETDLDPERFAALLDRIPHRLVRVNYDSGNSASLGYSPAAEFAAYGARVGSVHIKDRVRGGGSVPLGEGDADFDALFQALSDCRYHGDFVLQVARGEAGREIEWARQNVAWLDKRWAAAL